MRNTFYTLLIVLLAVVNLQAQNNHVVKVPTPDEKEVVGAIGGTVDVSALGGATYTIPIQVPEGLGGVQPNLSITYNSQIGNGLLGWGWNLGGMSAITRVGHTIYHDDGYVAGVDFEDDAFALDGQRLFAINGNSYGANGTEYKAETDGMGKIVSYTETLPGHGGLFGHGSYEMLSYFKVYTPEGLTLYYGKDKSDDDNARIIWEHDGKKVVVLWLLKRVEDQNGNYMVYNYCIGGHDYRLTDIQYCANPAARNEPDNERGAKYGVDFKYSERVDKETSFIGDYVLHQPWRLDSISVYYYNIPLYDYTFQYDGNCGQINSDYFYNRLQTIKFETRDGNGYKETTIKWGEKPALFLTNVSASNWHEQKVEEFIANSVKFPGDFNGDGFTDFIVAKKNLEKWNDSINPKSDDTYDLYLAINKGHDKTDENVGDINFELHNIATSKYVNWIYVIDINNDGVDDFIWSHTTFYYDAFIIKFNENNQIYLTPCIFHYSGQNHYRLSLDDLYYNGKGENAVTYPVQLLVGDFLGKGRQDVLITAPKDISSAGYLTYDENNGYIKCELTNAKISGTVSASGDFDGDGITEIWYADNHQGNLINIKLNTNGEIIKEPILEEFLDKYARIYTGDFNGDGRTDILTYNNNQSTWQAIMFKGKQIFYPIYNIGPYIRDFLGFYDPGEYGHSINDRENNMNYFFEVADMNGDGKSDIFIKNCSSVYVLFCPFYEYGSDDYRFVDIIKACPDDIGLGGGLYHCLSLGNYLGQENVAALNGRILFSLPQHSTYYNVASITDGMGNRTSFEYDYLVHNPYHNRSNIYDIDRIGENLLHGIYNKPIPIRAVKAIETTNINVSDFPISRTEYHYDNAMVHKFGHGFLGFEGITQTSSVGRRNISQTVRTFTFKPMDEHCTLTPESDRVYRFKEGETNPVLVSKTEYQHAKFVCELDELGKVFVPASIKTTTKNYELLGDRQMLRCRINEVRYNDLLGSGPFTYTQLVHPTETWQGTDATEQDDVQRCEFLTHTRTHYMGIAEPWVINRPKQVDTKSTRRTTGFAESKSLTLYTYMTDRPYLVKTVTNYPSGSELDDDLLATRTTFAYRTDGLVERDTVSAFQDHELDGRERVTSYDYTRSLRFVSEEDKQDGFVTHYGYDEVWGEQQWTDDCNGFRTFTDNPDHLGLTTYTYDADNTENHNRINGTESATALRWIGCDNYKTEYANDLDNAFYFSWAKSETSAETLTIYDAAGRELRTVTHGLTEDDIIFKDTQYDEWGRVLKVSEPYFRGEPICWTEYEYDDFDRTTSIKPPTYIIDGETWQPYTSIEYGDTDNNDQLVTITKTGAKNGDVDEFHQTESKVNIMGWTEWNKEYLDENLLTYNTTSYGYNADGSLAWTKVNDQDFTKVAMGYDNAGNRTTLVDPDYGTTTSVYDAFGQLTYQETPKHDYTEYEYDRHGRQTTRTETTVNSGTSETTTWTYKETPGQLGLLDSITLGNKQTITYSYDANNYNRLDNVVESINRDSYTTTYNYGDASFPLRTTGLIYPTGFEVSKEYESSTGKLMKIKHGDKDLWRTDAANALGQITDFTLGNGIKSEYRYDERHLLKSQTAENIQNFAYAYDIFANLAARTDNLHGMTESFEYDYLNRLEKITLNGTESIMGYDEYGRICSKQAQGQDVFSNAIYDDWKKPHAIREATVETNPFDGRSQVIQYTMFDKVKEIREGSLKYMFDYGYDHQRTRMTHTGNGILQYQKTYVGNCEYNMFMGGARVTTTYLSGPMGVFAYAEGNGNDFTLKYIHKDHLGSWTTITDGDGEICAEQSFDAWGNPRDPETWTQTNVIDPYIDRGFTGHEHLIKMDGGYVRYFGLINMNGRMYDPVMSTFLSVDNYVSSPDFSQAFNRYAYCLNNPLKYTDPDGEFPWNIVIGAGIGAITGGWQAMQEDHSFWYGAWRGALTGAVGGALSCVGGGSFFANVAWGTAEGALTGTLNAALWGKTGSDFGKQVAVGAAMGFFFSSAQSLAESVGNYNDYGMFGTNDGVFDRKVRASLCRDSETGKFILGDDGLPIVDAGKAQEALDFWQNRFGGPELTYQSNFGGKTTPSGSIYIGRETFLLGTSNVRAQISHEMGHYLDDIQWAGVPGESEITDKSCFKPTQEKYFANGKYDGTNGHYNAIKASGKNHVKYGSIAYNDQKFYVNGELKCTFSNPNRKSAWSDFGWKKWYYLIPRRNNTFAF